MEFDCNGTTVNISPADARNVLFELATDGSQLRESLEASPDAAREALADRNIVLPEGFLPSEIRLPDARKITHLLAAGDNVVRPGATPFGWLVFFAVFGAMPMTAGDGAG